MDIAIAIAKAIAIARYTGYRYMDIAIAVAKATAIARYTLSLNIIYLSHGYLW